MEAAIDSHADISHYPEGGLAILPILVIYVTSITRQEFPGQEQTNCSLGVIWSSAARIEVRQKGFITLLTFAANFVCLSTGVFIALIKLKSSSLILGVLSSMTLFF